MASHIEVLGHLRAQQWPRYSGAVCTELGARLNIKMSYQYKDPRVIDNTVSCPSYLKHRTPRTLERRSPY